MFKKLALSAFIAVAIAGVTGCTDDAKAANTDTAKSATDAKDTASKVAPELSFEEKVAVAVGTMYGNNLKMAVEETTQFDINLNKDKLSSAFVSALNGKAQMSNEEAQAVLTEFDTQMRAKQAAKVKATSEQNLKEGQAFLEKNKTAEGVQVTASGLQYKITEEGKGNKPTATDKIRVTYKGTNLKGEVFDQSPEPVEFPLNGVIAGWQEAFQLLPVGTKATLYIPANLAYGEFSPSEKIGPNSVLIFDVELIDIVKPEVKTEDKAESKSDKSEAKAK